MSVFEDKDIEDNPPPEFFKGPRFDTRARVARSEQSTLEVAMRWIVPSPSMIIRRTLQRFLQYLQHVVGCVCLAETGKNLLRYDGARSAYVGQAFTTRPDVVAVVVCVTRVDSRREWTRCRQEDLGYPR